MIIFCSTIWNHLIKKMIVFGTLNHGERYTSMTELDQFFYLGATLSKYLNKQSNKRPDGQKSSAVSLSMKENKDKICHFDHN